MSKCCDNSDGLGCITRTCVAIDATREDAGVASTSMPSGSSSGRSALPLPLTTSGAKGGMGLTMLLDRRTSKDGPGAEG